MQVQKQIIHKVSKNEFLDRLRQLASNNNLEIYFFGDSFLPSRYDVRGFYLLNDFLDRGVLYVCDSTELGMYMCDKAYDNAWLKSDFYGGRFKLLYTTDMPTIEELFNSLPNNIPVIYNPNATMKSLEKCMNTCLGSRLDTRYGQAELTVGQMKKMIDCVKKGLCKW